jgi:hypothetical protein
LPLLVSLAFLGLLCLSILIGLRGDGTPPDYISILSFRQQDQSDGTAALQSAIRASAGSGKALHITARKKPYITRPLELPSDTKIILEPGVIVEAAPGYKELESMITIEDAHNVEIQGNGAVFRMPKPEYKNGEERHCIAIRGSSDVHISSLSCNDSGGDGIYVGPGRAPYSSNVVVEDITLDNNRRQGISIVSAVGLWIRHCTCTHSNGAAPQSGIDIEPNRPNYRLQNIHIEDSVTSNNSGDGVVINLTKLRSRAGPVDVTVTGNRSENNGNSGYVAINEQPGHDGPAGTITIQSSTSVENGAYGAVASFYSSSGPSLVFRNLKVVDANLSRHTYDNAAIAIKRGGGGIGLQGNISFVGTTIIDKAHVLDHYFTLRDYSKVGYSKIKISDRGEWQGLPPSFSSGLLDGKPVETVDLQ